MLLLTRMCWYGNGTFEEQLDRAYQDFLAFTKRHKLPHSQPPFTPKMELRLNQQTAQVFILF